VCRALDLDHQHVNCWEGYSRFKILWLLLDDIEGIIRIHHRNSFSRIVFACPPVSASLPA
jgi:hypothetical protein